MIEQEGRRKEEVNIDGRGKEGVQRRRGEGGMDGRRVE